MGVRATIESTAALRTLCRGYGIGNRLDVMWMEEFTWGRGRFDLLTLDLADWTVRGFEIKASRSDFLTDKKWQNYLPYCHFFYFATLPGVIEKNELPSHLGHLELDEKNALVLRRRPKRLQPTFIRHTYGELFITRLLLSWIRNLQWRDSRINQHCPGCGERITPGDPRMGAPGYERKDDLIY